MGHRRANDMSRSPGAQRLAKQDMCLQRFGLEGRFGEARSRRIRIPEEPAGELVGAGSGGSKSLQRVSGK